LCHESLTAFEPEANGSLVEGLDFHKFYFDLANGNIVDWQSVLINEKGKEKRVSNVTITSPHVRILGNTAIIAYIRLIQTLDSNSKPITKKFEGKKKHFL
jgi:hypothetical protein